MTIYTTLYSFILLLTFLTWKKETHIASLWFSLASFFTFFLVATRDVTVGTDTASYVSYFLHPTLGYGGDNRKTDLGFQIWNELIHITWADEHFFLFVNAIVALSGVFYFIKKESPFKMVSLLLFLIAGEFYTIQFAAMRQTLAISFFLIALHFYNKGGKSWRIALAFYCAAIFFHATVLWCLPVVLLMDRIRINKTFAYIILGASFGIGLSGVFDYHTLVGGLFNMTDSSNSVVSRYSGYQNNMSKDTLSGHRVLWDMLPLTLVCAACIYYTWDINMKYLKYFLIGIIANNLTVRDPIAFRLVMYLVILVVVVVPIVFMRRKRIAILMYGIIIIYFSYKTYSLLNAETVAGFEGNKIVPYKFFFIDY